MKKTFQGNYLKGSVFSARKQLWKGQDMETSSDAPCKCRGGDEGYEPGEERGREGRVLHILAFLCRARAIQLTGNDVGRHQWKTSHVSIREHHRRLPMANSNLQQQVDPLLCALHVLIIRVCDLILEKE